MMIPNLATKIELGVTGVLSSIGLLAADDIPGWSELPSLAKVSIIGTFVVMVAFVLVSLMLMLSKERKDHSQQVRALLATAKESAEKQRQDFVDEVANSREHHNQVVERVCASFESSANVAHADSQAIIAELGRTRESNERLREHCAAVLARRASEGGNGG
jgi:mannitol-specific phosphotransferase system IIBC component